MQNRAAGGRGDWRAFCLRSLLGPRADDRAQRLRVTRCLIASASAVVVTALYWAGALAGFIPTDAVVVGMWMVLACIAGFLIAFRTGFNLRFADPSLTAAQICASIVVTSYVLYHAQQARDIYFLIYMVSFLFAVFQLGMRAQLVLAGAVLAAYATVVALLLANASQQVDVRLESLRLLVLGVVLGWFALMGGYIRALRARLTAARDSAQAASRAKSEFLANMSHEIRTPMNAVLGMTQLAMQTPLTPLQREYLETVADSSRSLLAILNDILDLSRVEAGRLTIEQVAFDPRAVLGQAMRPYALRADQKGLRFELRFAPGLPMVVAGDPVRVRQVLVNLVGNAIKFTERGAIEVEIGWQSPAEGESMLQLAVRDTGIGIPAEKQRAIFDAFAQADASTTREYGGTGLGLTISARLAALMGGAITVSSQAGVGSEFRVTIRMGAATSAEPHTGAAVVAGVSDPCSASDGESVPGNERRGLGQVPPANASATHLAQAGHSERRVLLVEDNRVNQAVAQAMLERLGWQVALSDNGQDAVEQARASRFDAILMDVQMPGMNGLEATAAIRAAESGTDLRVPIVALTANAMQGDREACIDAGMDGFLTKPIDMDELGATLDRMVPMRMGAEAA